jgi:cell division protein FtsB
MMEKGKPWVLFAVSVFYFTFLTTASYYKENGFRDIQKLSTAIQEMNKTAAQLAEENARYSKELAQINSSDMYVEAIARENMGLVKPGEIVFEFVDIEKLSPPLSPAGAAEKVTEGPPRG